MAREIHNIEAIKKGTSNESIIVLKCSGCGAALKTTDDKQLMECPYCNTKVMIPNLKEEEPVIEDVAETIETPEKEETLEVRDVQPAVPVAQLETPSNVATENNYIQQDNRNIHKIIAVEKQSKNFWDTRLSRVLLGCASLAVSALCLNTGAYIWSGPASVLAPLAIGGITSGVFGMVNLSDGLLGTNFLLKEQNDENEVEVEVGNEVVRDNNITATMTTLNNNNAPLLQTENQDIVESSNEVIHRQL